MIGHKDRVIDRIEDINKARVLNNKVLMKVSLTENQRSKAGLILNEGDFAIGQAARDDVGSVTRYGEVVKVPKVLHTTMKSGYGCVWDTDIEVEVGDIAYWGKMEAFDSPVIICGEQIYFLIRYEEIILVKRKDDIIPINGYCVVEEVKEMAESAFMIMDLTTKTNKKKGIIKYLGKPNRSYDTPMYDALDIDVGDTVHFQVPIFTHLEDSRFNELPSSWGYVQRRFIIASDINDN
jgi:hypothetical protein